MSTPRQFDLAKIRRRQRSQDEDEVVNPHREGVAAPLEPSAEVGCPNLYDRARSELGKVMEKFGVEIPQGDNSIEYLANMLAAAVSKNLLEKLARETQRANNNAEAAGANLLECHRLEKEIAALREKP